jgi:hypothetical protein
MRYMIVVKATAHSEAGEMPPREMFDEMAAYHERLAAAGVLVEGSGLQPSSKGFRIEWSGGQKTVTDGPFSETKELIAGYTIIKVSSEDEARRWAMEFPNPSLEDGAIEVRRLFTYDDFDDNLTPETRARFEKLDMGQ